MEQVYYNELETSAGQLLLCATDEGLCYVRFGSFTENESLLRTWLHKQMRNFELQHGVRHVLLEDAMRQMRQYFARTLQVFQLPLDIYGTAFQKQVWSALQQIEYGTTKSYKEIAEALAHPRAVRAVGMANNRNPLSIVIPCHRVIGHDGRLVGYGGGIEAKKALLALEGFQQYQ